jgi:hypothetical protein
MKQVRNQDNINALTGYNFPADNPQERRPCDNKAHKWEIEYKGVDGRLRCICFHCREQRIFNAISNNAD